MQDLRQTESWYRYMKFIGWEVVGFTGSDNARLFGRKFPVMPMGVTKLQRVVPERIDFRELKKQAQRFTAVAGYLEVDLAYERADEWRRDKRLERLREHGYRPTKSGLIPTKTRVIDISQSEAELKRQMKPKWRYNLGLSERRGLGVVIRGGSEYVKDEELYKQFTDLIAQNNKRIGMFGVPKPWMRGLFEAFLDEMFVVETYDKDGELAGAAQFLTSKDTCFYYHNGSSARGRRNMAPTRMVWEGMMEAKRRGKKWLDFEGIFDERFPQKRWKGFSAFKAGFGGKVIYYPPSFVKWLPGVW